VGILRPYWGELPGDLSTGLTRGYIPALLQSETPPKSISHLLGFDTKRAMSEKDTENAAIMDSVRYRFVFIKL
jgi:hypothetical protein